MTVGAKHKGCSTPAGNVNTCRYLLLIAGGWLKPYQTHADLPNQSTPFSTLFYGAASLPVIFNPDWLCFGFSLSQATADLKVPWQKLSFGKCCLDSNVLDLKHGQYGSFNHEMLNAVRSASQRLTQLAKVKVDTGCRASTYLQEFIHLVPLSRLCNVLRVKSMPWYQVITHQLVTVSEVILMLMEERE